MSIEVNLHPLLAEYTNRQYSVEVDGSTVGECLKQLTAKFPDIKGLLFEEDSKFSNSIDIFVNNDNFYTEELTKPVRDGDKLYLVMMLGCVR